MGKIISFLKGLSASTWIIIGIVLLIIIAIIIYVRNKSKDSVNGVSMDKTLSQNLQSTQAPSISPFPLTMGSRGSEVKSVQKYVNGKGESLVVDGIWGPLTDAAVLKVLKVSSVSQELYKTLV